MLQTVKGCRSYKDNSQPQAEQAGDDKKPRRQSGNKSARKDGAVNERQPCQSIDDIMLKI
jgi:hypothetical protein